MREHDEVEQLVVRTFQDHEVLAERGGDMLIQGVRRRAARRRRLRGGVALAAVGFLAVAAGVIPSLLGTGRPNPAPAVNVAQPQAGWRWESSLGAQIAVPQDWAVNDFGCRNTARSSVVRAPGAQPQCVGQEYPEKESAYIVGIPSGWIDDRFAILDSEEVNVDGVPATRRFGQLENGHFGGLVVIESRQLQVAVETLQAETAERILASLRLVDTDHSGCPTRRPQPSGVGTGPEPRTVPPGQLVPPDADTIAICWYERNSPGDSGPPKDRIETSARVAGEQARGLAAALNDAPAGGNPDVRESCAEPAQVVPDLLLLLTVGDETTRLWGTVTGCSGRGWDNGTARATITAPTLELVAVPLHASNLTLPGN